MNNYKLLKRIINKGYFSVFLLVLATALAWIAQNTLPPSNLTLPIDPPLPVPVWRSFLLMEGQLIPYRFPVLLFLLAMVLVILAFWGKADRRFPLKKLRLDLAPQGTLGEPSATSFNLNLGPEQSQMEIRFKGISRSWVIIRIASGFVVLAGVFALVTYFLFKTYSQTNLGLAMWIFSILLLLASTSSYDFLKNNPAPYRAKDFLWAYIALVYMALTIWLLTINNIWGLFACLLAITSIYAWKFKGIKPFHKLSLQPPADQPQVSLENITLVTKWRERISRLPALLSRRYEVLIFLLILVLGSFFRFSNIMDYAPGFNNDVSLLSSLATEYLRGVVPFSPFSGTGWGFETLFVYYIAFWMRIIGPSVFSARIASATVGVATIIVTYFFARRTAGKRVAWISTALLAVSGYHIIFSTLGSRLILQPFFEGLSFLLFWLALEKRKYWLFILTGISLGFTVQAYNASVLDPILIPVFFLFLLVRKWSKAKAVLQNYLLAALAILVAFLITAAPLLGYISTNWDVYRGRSNSLLVTHRMQESENNHPGTYWSPAVRNLFVGSLLFNQRGNSNDLYVEEPALDFPVNIVFVLALAFTARFWRKPLPFFLLAWFFLGLSAGYISEPNANRIIGSFVPLFIMCGLLLQTVVVYVKNKFHRPGKIVAGALTVLFVGACVIYTYIDYVGPNYKYRWGYAERATGVGVFVNSIRDRYDVYITDGYYVTDTVRMVNYRPGEEYNNRPYQRLSMYDVLANHRFTNNVSDNPSKNKDVAAVLGHWAEEERTRDVLLKLFPKSKLVVIPKINTHWDHEKDVGFGVLIPRDSLQQPVLLQNGLTAKYYRQWDGQGELFNSFVDPYLILPVLPDPDMGKFSTVWEGTFPADLAGTYGFILRSNNRSQLFVDEQMVAAITEFNIDDPERDQEVGGAVDLSPGSHRIKIIFNYDIGNLRFGILWKPPDRDYDWIPVWTFKPSY